MDELYQWILKLCINSHKDTAFYRDFLNRLEKFPSVLAELDYYRREEEFSAEVQASGYTVLDIMVWQIDHFKSHMDRGEDDMKNNPDCMVLMAFDTLLHMLECPDPYVQAIQSETGTDYEGKYR